MDTTKIIQIVIDTVIDTVINTVMIKDLKHVLRHHMIHYLRADLEVQKSMLVNGAKIVSLHLPPDNGEFRLTTLKAQTPLKLLYHVCGCEFIVDLSVFLGKGPKVQPIRSRITVLSRF